MLTPSKPDLPVSVKPYVGDIAELAMHSGPSRVGLVVKLSSRGEAAKALFYLDPESVSVLYAHKIIDYENLTAAVKDWVDGERDHWLPYWKMMGLSFRPRSPKIGG